MNIAQAVKSAREAAGMSQAELAANTTLTIDKIQAIEEDLIEYNYIDKRDLDSLSQAFGVPLEILTILGLEKSDIKKGRENIADSLLPPMRNLILELIKKE